MNFPSFEWGKSGSLDLTFIKDLNRNIIFNKQKNLNSSKTKVCKRKKYSGGSVVEQEIDPEGTFELSVQ